MEDVLSKHKEQVKNIVKNTRNQPDPHIHYRLLSASYLLKGKSVN